MFVSREKVITVDYEIKWKDISYFQKVTRGGNGFVLAVFKDNHMFALTIEEYVQLKYEWMRDTGRLKDVEECVLQL